MDVSFSHNAFYGLICNRILKINISSFIIWLVELITSEMQFIRILNDHKGTKPHKCHPTWYLIFLVSLCSHQLPYLDICLSHPSGQCHRSVDNSTSTKGRLRWSTFCKRNFEKHLSKIVFYFHWNNTAFIRGGPIDNNSVSIQVITWLWITMTVIVMKDTQKICIVCTEPMFSSFI